MKKFLLLFAFALTTTLSFSQDISDVSQSSNGRLTVRDDKNNEISAKYIGDSDELCGFSSNIIVVKSSNGRVTIYDQKFNEISAKYIGDSDRVKNVNGNNIIIKSSNGRITTYDKKFNEISARYE